MKLTVRLGRSLGLGSNGFKVPRQMGLKVQKKIIKKGSCFFGIPSKAFCARTSTPRDVLFGLGKFKCTRERNKKFAVNKVLKLIGNVARVGPSWKMHQKKLC